LPHSQVRQSILNIRPLLVEIRARTQKKNFWLGLFSYNKMRNSMRAICCEISTNTKLYYVVKTALLELINEPGLRPVCCQRRPQFGGAAAEINARLGQFFKCTCREISINTRGLYKVKAALLGSIVDAGLRGSPARLALHRVVV
jgi:hypothetical protein